MIQGTTKKRINLIPKEFRIKQIYDLRKILSACIFFSLIAVGLIYLYQITKIEAYQKKIATYQMIKGKLTKEKIDLENILLNLERISGEEKRVEKIANVTKEILEKRIVWSEVLKKLTHLVPPTIWLNHLYVIDEEVREKGNQKPEITKKLILKGSSLDNQGVTDFLKDLEQSGLFSQVALEYGEKKRKGNLTLFDFEVRCELKRQTP